MSGLVMQPGAEPLAEETGDRQALLPEDRIWASERSAARRGLRAAGSAVFAVLLCVGVSRWAGGPSRSHGREVIAETLVGPVERLRHARDDDISNLTILVDGDDDGDRPPIESAAQLAAKAAAEAKESAAAEAAAKAARAKASAEAAARAALVEAEAKAAAVAAAAKAKAELEKLCGGEGGNRNCVKSRCCKEPGMQCYSKNNYWAECMEECTWGPNLFDNGSSAVWYCQPLGPRTPGTPKKCSADNENCLGTQCCAGIGMQCFRKNATFGACKATCELGTDMSDDDWAPWSCEEVGVRNKLPAPWIETHCSKGPENCVHTQCCSEEGFQCYLGSKYWGQCKPRCNPWQWDACAPVGMRTPKLASRIMAKKRRVGPWVEKRCSGKWEDCRFSACCHEVGTTCFEKDDKYATCRAECNSSVILEESNETWSCEALGPQSWGLATRGYPSLYCVSVYMPEHYEGPLLRSVLKRDAGIFACDGFDVFANRPDTLGYTAGGMEVKSVIIPVIQVGISQDGTAGNAKLFMAMWDKVIAGGRFRYYDWTIKVDPDAVILPWRLRGHLAARVGETVYVANCDKYPFSPNFPMMYGAVEIFSQAAMATYADASWRCGKELPWHQWGEDYFMTHCMEYIGVDRIDDFGVLGDNVCIGANCEDPGVASFHPFKTEGDWHACWNAANDLPPGSEQSAFPQDIS